MTVSKRVHGGQPHVYPRHWTQGHRRVSRNSGRLWSELQVEALQDERQHDLYFRHGEIQAQAGPGTCTKGKIRKLLPGCGVFRRKTLWKKLFRFRPPLGMAVGDVRKNEQIGR